MENFNDKPFQQLLTQIDSINWQVVYDNLDQYGYAVIPKVLTKKQCSDLIRDYDQEGSFRKTVNMQRYRFGNGEYKYYRYPLPTLIQFLRETLYKYLSQHANQYMEKLGINQCFPSTLSELTAKCVEHQQTLPTALILKYSKGGYNTLHQDIYGDIYFPVQAAILLNEPEKDFIGGEFVLTEQVPRAQSIARVVSFKQGDLVVFPTQYRPVRSNRGYYRAAMKHGVSKVHQGCRHTLGIIFHDAVS